MKLMKKIEASLSLNPTSPVFPSILTVSKVSVGSMIVNIPLRPKVSPGTGRRS